MNFHVYSSRRMDRNRQKPYKKNVHGLCNFPREIRNASKERAFREISVEEKLTRHVTRVDGSKGNPAIGGDKQAAIKLQLLASNYGVFTVSPIQLIDIFTSFVNNIE